MSEQVFVSGQGVSVSVEGTLTVTFPEPPSSGWEFRGVFCRDEDFAACKPALGTLGMSAIECAAFSGSSNSQLLNRLNAIAEPFWGWVLFGSGFTPSSAGGSFGISDAKLDSLMAGVAEHPRNSHRYQIADEINLTGFTGTQLQANLDTFRARAERVRGHDPQAVVSVTDYRQAQLQPGLWLGVVDEVKLDGYPNWVPYQEETIPNQATWCDAVGMAYSAVASCHEFNLTQPKYPTQAQFDHQVEQWAATDARDFYLYVWDDGVAPSLSTDAAMQAHIGETLALYTP